MDSLWTPRLLHHMTDCTMRQSKMVGVQCRKNIKAEGNKKGEWI